SRAKASRTLARSPPSWPPCGRPTMPERPSLQAEAPIMGDAWSRIPEHPMTITYQQPDARGHFGIYGGSFVSETLTCAINELKAAYAQYQNDPAFLAEFRRELAHYVG